MRRFFRATFLALAVSVLIPVVAQAASSSANITISPFLREVRFPADEATKDFSVQLTNNTGTTQNFRLSVLDFGSLDASGGVVFAGSDASKLSKKYGLANWLQLGQKNLELKSKETAEIKATILNDSNLSPGGHYAAIIASIDAATGTSDNQVNINRQISSLILATKVGGEKYDLKLNGVSSNGNWLHLPGEVSLNFSNPGNVHVVPRGTVKLLAVNGSVVAQGVINEESSYVLPETERVLTVKLNKTGSVGLWPAAYKLQIDYRYDGIDQIARREQSLYFLNAQSFIALAAFGGVTAVLVRKVAKYRKKGDSKHKN